LRTSDPDTAKKLKAAHEGDIARGIPLNPKINQIESWQLCEMVLEDLRTGNSNP